MKPATTRQILVVLAQPARVGLAVACLAVACQSSAAEPGNVQRNERNATALTPVAPLGTDPAGKVLDLLLASADPTRQPQVLTSRSVYTIGVDYLEFTVTSPQAGYAYVLARGSSGRLTLLFPNRIDRDHELRAHQPLLLPRPTWRLRARGPAGRNTLLIMVAESANWIPAPTQGGPAFAEMDARSWLAELTQADGSPLPRCDALKTLVRPLESKPGRSNCTPSNGAAQLELHEK